MTHLLGLFSGVLDWFARAISKNQLWLRFRLPGSFVDLSKMTKEYKGWFFSKGKEIGYQVTDINNHS